MRKFILALALAATSAQAQQIAPGTIAGSVTTGPRGAAIKDNMAIPQFDGHLVTWAFINQIAPDPVLRYSVRPGPGAPVLRLTVLKGSTVVTFDLAEEKVEGIRAGYAGYTVLARARVEAVIDGAGSNWPFFGDPGMWVHTEVETFMPGLRGVNRAKLPRGAQALGLVGSARHDFSIPSSSEGAYFDSAVFDATGAPIYQSGGTTIAASDPPGSVGAEYSAYAFCGDLAQLAANKAVTEVSGIYDPMAEALKSDDAGTALGGAVGALVGGLGGRSPQSTAAGGAAGALLVKYANDTWTNLVSLTQDAMDAQVEWAGYNAAFAQCLENVGAISPREGLVPMPEMVENPNMTEAPPPGAHLQLVCLEWTGDWSEWDDSDPSDIEVIYHASKCVRMEAQWIVE